MNSLFTQTRQIDEIIVVDDGSTDNTADILSKFQDKITVIRKENGGKASALNRALSICQSDYVWVCDDDDIAEPDALEIMARELDGNPDIGYVFGLHKIFMDTPNGRVYKDTEYWARQDEPNYKICFLEGLFAFQFATLVRASVYRDIGNFREDLLRSQDYEMAIRISRKYSTKFIPHIIFNQRQHDDVRGTAIHKFSVEDNEKRWMHFDSIFFLDTIQNYGLDEFTPSFALEWGEREKMRAACIQKACIFANRGMWDVAAQALESAEEYSKEALSSEEKSLPGKYYKSRCSVEGFV